MIAVATRRRADMTRLELDQNDESDLELVGFVTFLDPPKPDLAESLEQLRGLGIRVPRRRSLREAHARRSCCNSDDRNR